MPPISRYMTRQPWTIRADAPLTSAKQMMREHGIRHLPVLEGGKLVGIVSDRDVLQLERFGHAAHESRVEEAMSEDVYTADPDEPVDVVVEEMAVRKYGSTVVVKRGPGVEGIFTTVDGMQVLADVLRRASA